jgi:AraC-like DNA-binding protein
MSHPAATIPRPNAGRDADLLGVRVLDVHLGPGDRRILPEHSIQLLVIRRGAGRMTGDCAAPRISPCEVILLPVGMSACLEPTSEQPLTALMLEAPEALASLSGDDDLPSGSLSLDPAVERTILRALMRVQFENEMGSTTSKGAATTGLRIEMSIRALSFLARPTSSPAPRTHPLGSTVAPLNQESLQRVRGYVDQLDRLLHEPSDVDRAATALGLSRRRFTDLFRQLTGSAWQPYLQEVRVRHALRLLSQGSTEIPLVAFACGFDDPSTFYRAFRRVTGTTPKGWLTARRLPLPARV